MKQLLLFIYFLFFSSLLFSQQRDINSLKNILKITTNKESRLILLAELDLIYYNYQITEESLEYYLEMLQLAKSRNKNDVETTAYGYIINYYLKAEDFENAEKYALESYNKPNQLNISEYLSSCNQVSRVYDYFQEFEKAISAYKKAISAYKKNSESSVIIIYNNLGQAYAQIGEVELETTSLLKAINYSEKYKDFDKRIFAFYNLGWKYMSLGQYAKAERYYLKGFKDSSKVKLVEYIYNIHHALGINYSRWGKYKKALKHNNLALKYFKNTGYKLYEFDVLNNIAVVYSRMNNLPKTVEYGKKALKIAKEINNTLAISVAQQTLGNAYLNLKQYDQAEQLYLEIIKDITNKKIIGRESKIGIYSDLAALYENKKDFKKALHYHKYWKKLNDSILTESRDSKFADVETKYHTEKKEKENLGLKQQNNQQALLTEKEKTKKWVMSSGWAVSLAGLGIFFLVYLRSQKQKQEIEKKKNLVEELQRELHHRLKNNLSFIDFFITLAKGKFPDPAYNQKLDELQNRINSMFEVHKQLFKKKDVTSVNAKTYISALVENVKKAYSEPNITIEENIKNTNLRADISFPIGLIVNEFVTNSYKYAFPNNEKGIIAINLIEDLENYHLKLTDNGKGLPKNFNIDQLDSFGMETIKLLTVEYKGTFKLDGTKGIQMDISFPKNAT